MDAEYCENHNDDPEEEKKEPAIPIPKDKPIDLSNFCELHEIEKTIRVG